MNCPICANTLVGSNIINKIYSQENLYCEACNSYHIPEQIDDKAYYENEYHDNFQYKQSAFKYRMTRLFPALAYRAMARYDYLKRHIALKKHSQFIEVGGGSGENFLVFDTCNNARKYTVVEPGDAFAQSAPNLTHISDIIENTTAEQLGDADLIMMFHVLEHIYDLSAFFNKLKTLDWKYFYFEVPNILNPKAKEDSLVDNPHYHHFSEKSITEMVQSLGFKVVTLDGVEPISYHPFKKVGLLAKYVRRLFHKNEQYPVSDGMYLRCIIENNR